MTKRKEGIVQNRHSPTLIYINSVLMFFSTDKDTVISAFIAIFEDSDLIQKVNKKYVVLCMYDTVKTLNE